MVNNLSPGAMPVRVFTLQLGWEKEREDARDIRATMATITEVLKSPPPNLVPLVHWRSHRCRAAIARYHTFSAM